MTWKICILPQKSEQLNAEFTDQSSSYPAVPKGGALEENSSTLRNSECVQVLSDGKTREAEF